MEFYIIILLFAAMTVLYYLYRHRASFLLRFAVTGDEDMKIAGSSFPPAPAEDPAEMEARTFLRQKSVGNIEKARELGKSFAKEILELATNSPLGKSQNFGQMEAHHQLVLCSFIVNRVIAELSPNSILAQTSLQVFYDEVERSSSVLYTHISDPAAFSLYVLWERSYNRDEDEIGRIYAKLCGMEYSRKAVSDGNRLNSWFYETCVDMVKHTAYEETP